MKTNRSIYHLTEGDMLIRRSQLMEKRPNLSNRESAELFATRNGLHAWRGWCSRQAVRRQQAQHAARRG